MSEIWYYADGESPRGPMPIQDLVAALSVTHNPTAIQVWRPGMTGWQRAGDTPEVIDFFRPPPIPRRPEIQQPPIPSPPAQKTTYEPPSAAGMSPQGAAAPLKGIGGWLALLALGQTLAPVRMIVSLANYYTELDGTLVRRFPAVIVGEALMNLLLFSFAILTTVRMYQHSKQFPRLFIWECLLGVLIFPISMIWTAIALSFYTGESATKYFAAPDAKTTGEAFAGLVGATIWIAYLAKSKRAANTFVK